MALQVPKRFSLRKRAVSRRGAVSAPTSARPSRVSPRRLEFKCRASRPGKVVTALRSTCQSRIALPSKTSDFSFGSGCRGSPSLSKMGMPSVMLLRAKCKCSRQGKALAASMFNRVSHVTRVLLSTRFRTQHTKGLRTKRAPRPSVGAPRGTGRVPPPGNGAKRVRVSDSHSSCGQSSQMAAASAQSAIRHLSSQRLFRLGRLQSPCQTSSG
mmetsp:Transcript_9834/g.26688  ORF Transcript_9834/g.26688 Transcript_9834/m.26688 type:complete len:212 (-) Transcript_9834:496-1131(-)